MKFIKNHYYYDIHTHKLMIFDSENKEQNLYFFMDIDNFCLYTYSQNEIQYLKEY